MLDLVEPCIDMSTAAYKFMHRNLCSNKQHAVSSKHESSCKAKLFITTGSNTLNRAAPVFEPHNKVDLDSSKLRKLSKTRHATLGDTHRPACFLIALQLSTGQATNATSSSSGAEQVTVQSCSGGVGVTAPVSTVAGALAASTCAQVVLPPLAADTM